MRVLLCIHHFLDPNAGAPGLTVALGEALERHGCAVDYLAFDQVYGVPRREVDDQPSSGDTFARRLAATAGRGAVRFRRATFPLMGGKVSGLNLHSRLTGEVHLAGFRKYWRRAMPARISAAGFSCPGRGRLLCVLGRGGTARKYRQAAA